MSDMLNTVPEECADPHSAEAQKAILRQVYDALREKGYNPIVQIVGYLLSEDPAYITNCNNARALIRKIDRDQILNELVRNYLETDGDNEK